MNIKMVVDVMNCKDDCLDTSRWQFLKIGGNNQPIHTPLVPFPYYKTSNGCFQNYMIWLCMSVEQVAEVIGSVSLSVIALMAMAERF